MNKNEYTCNFCSVQEKIGDVTVHRQHVVTAITCNYFFLFAMLYIFILQVALYDNARNGTVRKGSPSMPSSPSKNSDFPLR